MPGGAVMMTFPTITDNSPTTDPPAQRALIYSWLYDFSPYVALVTKKTYVECTEYVRRHTPATASSRQPQTTNKRTMAVSSGFWYYDI